MTDVERFVAPGTPIDLTNCEREALHWIGSVQPHATLVCCEDRAPFAVVQRTVDRTGLLALPDATTLADLLGPEDAARAAELAGRPGPPVLRPERLPAGTWLRADADVVAYRPAPGLLAVEVEAAATDAGALDGTPALLAGIGAQRTVDELLVHAVGALRRLTGHDRVWAYRFEADGHGVVVAEDRAPGLEPFLGLHYPASDIPAQARELFLRNGVRVIADVDADPVALEPLRTPSTSDWLDLSDSGVRAVSPMHVLYLQAMGVRASMSVALVVDGALWGLLSAHHYAAPRRPSPAVRAQAGVLGQVTSMQLALLRDLGDAEERLALDRHADGALAAATTGDAGVLAGLVDGGDDVRALAGADGVVLDLGGERRCLGATPADAELDALLAAVERHEAADGTIALDDLARREPGTPTAATGVLGFRLGPSGRDRVLWLRGPWEEAVTWGHRDKALVRRDEDGALALGPRESFERWAEGAAGRSRPWTTAERQAVTAFRQALATFVLARAEELAAVNAELERSNDDLETFAFAAAHDLQEPLRGIHNFTGFLVEDHGEALGADGLELTATILRLAERSSSLLQALLTFAQAGRTEADAGDSTVGAAVDEVRQLLAEAISAAGARVVLDGDAVVALDRVQLEQVLLNLVANALKYGGPSPEVRIGAAPADVPGWVDVTVEDDGIGIPAEHHETVFGLFRRLHPRDAYGGGSGAGLAIVRQVVERHGGRVVVDSEPGRGSRFTCRLRQGTAT